jgi:hypothetical protein
VITKERDPMKYRNIILCLVTLVITPSIFSESLFPTRTTRTKYDAEWAIIGAGPAGIIVLGVLLDLGTDPKSIIWIDQEFSCGRLCKYGTVPGNAKTWQFIEFLNSCKTFQECNSPAAAKLYDLDQEFEYPLQVIVDPLIDISYYLCGKVNCKKDKLCALNFANDVWNIGTTSECFTANHVILATGSHPKRLDYDCKNEIPLDLALDKPALATQVDIKDTIAVVGSGQSAILLLKHLSELSCGRIINFFRNPIEFGGESGLKGQTARWAQDVLLKTPPVNLVRMFNSCDSLKAWLPICTKIVYAVGFERNELPTIANAPNINFDDKNGILGPRLFGIGIAFPEKYTDENGNTISRIGLMSFMEYAQEILPTWMAVKSPLSRYAQFEDLFTIDIL